MSTLLKMIVLVLFMNLFLYIGLNLVKSSDGYYINQELKFYFKGDLIDTLMGDQVSMSELAQHTRDNYTDYDIEFSEAISIVPSQYGGEETGTGGISFLDSLKIIWLVIPTILNIAISPLTLLFNFRMPVLFGLMLGVPYFVIIVFSVIMMIRGVSD